MTDTHSNNSGALPEREWVSVFGVKYQIGTMEEALSDIDSMIENNNGKAMPCAFVNAHCLNIAFRNMEYVNVLNSFPRVWADGIGAAIGAKRSGKNVKANVNGTDMLPLLCDRGHSIYLLGGKPGVAEAAMKKLNETIPNAKITGAWHGYFGDDPTAPLDDIAQKKPDIVLVGMGVPRQEFWLNQFKDKLSCKVCIGVGGLLDFASGRIPRAPMWMRKIKFEWLFRLIQEPKRLFKRYVIGNPLFLWRVFWHPNGHN